MSTNLPSNFTGGRRPEDDVTDYEYELYTRLRPEPVEEDLPEPTALERIAWLFRNLAERFKQLFEKKR